MDALLRKFGKDWPELKGVIHAAGVIDDGILSSQDWNKFEKVFAPKVQGSWNLHEASLNKHLDFFVLFSSIASSIGSPGQINYSSANAYMDGLAYFRQEKGLPALSINWGPWAEIGLAANLTERHSTGGFYAFKPDEGIKAFELALAQTTSQITIVNIDWSSVHFQQGLLSELIPSKKQEIPILIQSLIQADPSKRMSILDNYLQKTVGQILGLSFINPEQGFFEAGMDSLMAVELRNRIQMELGKEIELSGAFAFNYPNVNSMATYLKETLYKNKKIMFDQKSEEINDKQSEIEQKIKNMDFDELNKLLD